jgi:hypothetical protein
MSSIKEQRVSRVWPKAVATLLFAAIAAACAPQPEPRSVLDFREDGLARDGVLTRCNRNRDENRDEVECANARRAASTLAIEAERAHAAEFERESERKLAALRNRQDSADSGAAGGTSGTPVFGTPVGRVMPSMAEVEVYAEAGPLGRHNVEVAPAEPPSNELGVLTPEIELADVAVIPRPFLTDDATAPR